MPFLPDVVMLGSMPLAISVVAGLLGALLAYLLMGWPRGEVAAVEGARDLVLNLLIGGLLAAKLFYVLQDPLSYVENPAALLIFPYGPAAGPVGLLGGVALAAWGLRSRPDRLKLLDRAALPLLAGVTLGSAGLKGPGLGAFAPLLLLSLSGGWLLARRAKLEEPGDRFATTLILATAALVAADLGRPSASLWGGISLLQLTAAVVATCAWLWLSRKTPGT